MLGGAMGLGMFSGDSVVELTPVFSVPLNAVQHVAGACVGATVSPSAVLRLTWTVLNPTSSYKVYQDGVLIATVSDSPHDITFSGERFNGSSPTTYARTFRVDAMLSLRAVGASSSVVSEYSLGGCSGGLES